MSYEIRKSLSFYLFAIPSFTEGMARNLDLAGNLDVYNEHPTGSMADTLALKTDWKMAGQDIAKAVQTYESKPGG